MSKRSPRIHLALQYVIRNFFRIDNVIAVRLGRSVNKLPKHEGADGCTLIHFVSDVTPYFHFYETVDTQLDVMKITNSNKSRITQCLTKVGCEVIFDDTANKTSQLMPHTSDDQQGNDPQSQQHDQLESGNEPSEHSQPAEIDISGQLPTIHEDDAETT